ncbi:Hypothetical predicted protein, partial [Paramuricea clavata]
SSSLTPTEQRYVQIEKETLAIVHVFHKFDQLLFVKSDVTVDTDHKPLETIFNRPLASARRRLQSMMVTLQRYTFKVEYHKGSTLLLADTLSRAPLPATTHKPVHNEMVYRVDFEADNPELSGFQDALQEIRAAALTDPKQIEVQALVESGWPAQKISVPVAAQQYWSVRHEIKSHDGIKEGHLPCSMRKTILNKLHAAHRGPDFTLRHARSCVFWPGLTSQITTMCKTCIICAQHTQKHPREPLQPYPSNGCAEAAVKSAKHILLTADDFDLPLLSVRNTAPAGHTFSPAQRLFGRVLRSNLPQPSSTLLPSTPPQDIVVKDHTERKSQQKRAYDKRVGPPLPHLQPETKVFAKPSPTSSAKVWIPGKLIGSACPRSYIIKTGMCQHRTPIQRSQMKLFLMTNSQTLRYINAWVQDCKFKKNRLKFGLEVKLHFVVMATITSIIHAHDNLTFITRFIVLRVYNKTVSTIRRIIDTLN